MHLPLTLLSSALGLAAVCSTAALPADATPPPGQFDNLDDLIPAPIPIGTGNSLGATFRVSNNAAVQPPVDDVLDVDALIAKGGNATEAPPSAGGGAPGGGSGGGETLGARYIHGPDNRFLQTSKAYPFSAMGRVRITWGSSQSWCTGSLVGGRVVAMARHCLKTGGSYVFSPAYYNGNRYPTAYAVRVIRLPGTSSSGCSYKDDWALLILNKNLAATNGYLGVKGFSSSLANKNIFWNYGYPQDKSATGQLPYAQSGIKVWKASGCSNGGPLLHNGDSWPGQSGSPVWLPPDAQGHRYQYGVHVASNKNNGLMAHGTAFINAVIAARKAYP